jgi:hypothetical protein
VVLKTVIAEDETGERSMDAWAVHETRMLLERRLGGSGRPGWTVTWKGRGWDRSFDDYLGLLRSGRDLMRAGKLVVIPSAKYHLPAGDAAFREREYRHTTAALAGAWGDEPLMLEKDFSPTLAGDPRAGERATILRWLREVPGLIRDSSPVRVHLAIKLMNARFDDAFQVEMMRAAAAAGADALVCFNRLFDFERQVAYGGWDLSDRNLRVLHGYRSTVRPSASPTVRLIGTGNVCSGELVIEYARGGCECVELHTFFQLPLGEYPATHGTRTQRALHTLVFNPRDGLVAGLLRLEAAGHLERRAGALHFSDVVRAN